ncbi:MULTISPECIES: hypothetical protein [Aeromonas]|uniref:hypothetical protein n=1 Tax=Aeromonas TaxID=642 RepID=UPI00083A3534|nr:MULTISPECIES: hypothetical protein [Aeromonas]
MTYQNKLDVEQVEQIEALEHFWNAHVDRTLIDRYLLQLAQAEAVLEQRNQDLIKQIEQRASFSLEQLQGLLPAIYRNFYSHVAPSDLPLLAGELKQVSLPSPYPEPTADALQIVKRRIRKMSVQDRAMLYAFCQQNVPARLEMRPDFKELLQQGDADA